MSGHTGVGYLGADYADMRSVPENQSLKTDVKQDPRDWVADNKTFHSNWLSRKWK